MRELAKYILINDWYIPQAMRRINDKLFSMGFDITTNQYTLCIYKVDGELPKNCILNITLRDEEDFFKIVKQHFDKELKIEHTRNNDTQCFYGGL